MMIGDIAKKSTHLYNKMILQIAAQNRLPHATMKNIEIASCIKKNHANTMKIVAAHRRNTIVAAVMINEDAASAMTANGSTASTIIANKTIVKKKATKDIAIAQIRILESKSEEITVTKIDGLTQILESKSEGITVTKIDAHL